MSRIRQPDPRALAREIPGLLDAVLPQLTPGVVAHLNRTARKFSVELVSADDMRQSQLPPSMLFELALVISEFRVLARQFEWDECLAMAVERQRRYFDAVVPAEIAILDRALAERVASNLLRILKQLESEYGGTIEVGPAIPGLEWISNSRGDFAIGPGLIEVKCSSRRFSASDYRQLTLYWLLALARAFENPGRVQWSKGHWINPRLGVVVTLDMLEFLELTAAGATAVEVSRVFREIVGARSSRVP